MIAIIAVLAPFIMIVLIVFIVIGLPVLMSWHRSTRDQTGTEEEYRLVQQIHADMEKLERRIVSLETILFDEKSPGGENENSGGTKTGKP